MTCEGFSSSPEYGVNNDIEISSYTLPAPASAVVNDSTTLVTSVRCFPWCFWVMKFIEQKDFKLPPNICCKEDTAYSCSVN